MKNQLSNKIYIILFLVVYLKPFNISLIPVLDKIFQIGKILVTGLLLVMFVCQRRKVSKITKLCWLFLLAWIIGLVWNKNFSSYMMEILTIFGVFLFFDYYRPTKYVKYIYKTLYNIAVAYICLHTLTILLDHPLFATPIISYDKYFLGGDNRSAFILIVLCSILFLYDLKYKRKISLFSYVISLVGFFGLAYTFAVAGLVAYTILLLTTVFLFDPFINKVFNLKTCTLVIVLVVGFVVFFYNPKLVNAIGGLVGKKGLSSREFIWPLAFKRFLERPAFGYGALTNFQIENYYLYGTTHAHNIILEFLMMTGIIGSFFFVKFFKSSLKICKKEEKRSVYRMFIVGLSSFLICSLFDFYIGLIYFYMFIGLLTFTSTRPVEYEMSRG